MKLFVLILACALLQCAVASLSNAYLVMKYHELQNEYHQNMLRSGPDEQAHFKEFKVTAEFIQDHNTLHGEEWHAGYNIFSTMTSAEKGSYTGLNVSSVVMEQRNARMAKRSVDLNKRNPSSADYSSKLPAIKNQGSCGSCWTFGATAALEYQVNKDRTGNMKALSEQQYLDCVYEGSRDGCNGGWPTDCYDWTKSNGNMIASQANMPYLGSDGTCNTNVASAISGFSVTGSTYLAEGDAAMENAVADSSIGVISVAIGVVNSFYSFTSGVYSGSDCSSINHAVDVVGYGTLSGVGYFRVRNSWGDWGDNGYINMKRGLNGANINTCAVASYGHYPVVTGADDGSDDGSDDNDDGSDDNDDGGDDDSDDGDNTTCTWEVTENKKLKVSLSGLDYTLAEAKAACIADQDNCLGVSCKNKNKCMLNGKNKSKTNDKFSAYVYSCSDDSSDGCASGTTLCSDGVCRHEHMC